MAQRRSANESIEARVARLEEIADGLSVGYREDRIEAKEDRKEIIRRLDGLTQTLQSTGTAVANLALEKCGERLAALEKSHDEISRRCDALDRRTASYPIVETEVQFWRRVLGGGIHAAWKIASVMLGSGAIGALAMRYVFH